MPESLEEIATCALYEPTAQREAVLAREIIALREAYVQLAVFVGISEENARRALAATTPTASGS